jgi:hypothetical protein
MARNGGNWQQLWIYSILNTRRCRKNMTKEEKINHKQNGEEKKEHSYLTIPLTSTTVWKYL